MPYERGDPSGNGHQGQLGTAGGDSSPTPVAVPGIPPTAQLALGSDHGCATTTMGEVLCWGSNEFGQLGIGKGVAKIMQPSHVEVTGKVVQLVASDMDTCALATEHEVYCWGENLRGEAGASNMATRIAWVPNHVAIASHSRQLAAAYSTLCAVKDDGHIVCWGYLTSHLGPGFDASTSGEVPGIDEAIKVAVGYAHACALRRDGSVWCWGKDDFGQLGDGRNEAAWTPTAVRTKGRATDVVAGMRNTCARLEDLRWYCWGDNRSGQIGPRSQPLIATPTLLDLSQVDLASQ